MPSEKVGNRPRQGELPYRAHADHRDRMGYGTDRLYSPECGGIGYREDLRREERIPFDQNSQFVNFAVPSGQAAEELGGRR